MATIKVEVKILCVCNQELRQIAIVGSLHGNTITVSPCPICQEEAFRQAYNKGFDYGRRSKD